MSSIRHCSEELRNVLFVVFIVFWRVHLVREITEKKENAFPFFASSALRQHGPVLLCVSYFSLFNPPCSSQTASQSRAPVKHLLAYQCHKIHLQVSSSLHVNRVFAITQPREWGRRHQGWLRSRTVHILAMCIHVLSATIGLCAGVCVTLSCDRTAPVRRRLARGGIDELLSTTLEYQTSVIDRPWINRVVVNFSLGNHPVFSNNVHTVLRVWL